MDAISDGMRGVLMLPTNERLERQETVVRYLASNLNTHGAYAIRYFFCEFLNFANVVSIISLWKINKVSVSCPISSLQTSS